MLKDNVSQIKLKLSPSTEGDPSHIPGTFQAPEEIVHAIQSWWGSKGSDMLWIQNCHREIDEPSVARELVTFAKEAQDVMVLSYFCQRVDPEGLPFDKAEQFLDLLYSLIRQFCTSITEDLFTSLDLSSSRFSTLDGTLDSTDVALQLLRDLLSLATEPILIAIDELEVLDFSGEDILEGYLQRLFEMLRNENGSAVIKTLFTTVENSLMVMNAVGWESTVDANLGSGSEGFMTLEGFGASWS